MNRDELPLVTLDLRWAGQLLAHPCHCHQPNCNLGTHLWNSTSDMARGIRAQAFEPATTFATGPPNDNDPPPDRTARLHADYEQLLYDAQHAARKLRGFISQHRPDRFIPEPPAMPASDDMWCTNHLENFGTCEPRHRGELCRWCDDTRRLHGFTPDRQLMRARHESRRITDAMLADAKKRGGHRNTQKRRKAG